MRLVTLWLVASTEAFRVHGVSAATAAPWHGAKGVQGKGKRGRETATTATASNEISGAGGTAGDVCKAGDSTATCQELTAKYRGGGEFVR